MKTKKKDVLNRFLPLWAIPGSELPDLLGKQRPYSQSVSL